MSKEIGIGTVLYSTRQYHTNERTRIRISHETIKEWIYYVKNNRHWINKDTLLEYRHRSHYGNPPKEDVLGPKQWYTERCIEYDLEYSEVEHTILVDKVKQCTHSGTLKAISRVLQDWDI